MPFTLRKIHSTVINYIFQLFIKCFPQGYAFIKIWPYPKATTCPSHCLFVLLRSDLEQCPSPLKGFCQCCQPLQQWHHFLAHWAFWHSLEAKFFSNNYYCEFGWRQQGWVHQQTCLKVLWSFPLQRSSASDCVSSPSAPEPNLREQLCSKNLKTQCTSVHNISSSKICSITSPVSVFYLICPVWTLELSAFQRSPAMMEMLCICADQYGSQ